MHLKWKSNDGESSAEDASRESSRCWKLLMQRLYEDHSRAVRRRLQPKRHRVAAL